MPRGMLEFWLDPESPYYKKKLLLKKQRFYIALLTGEVPWPQNQFKTWVSITSVTFRWISSN